MPRAFRTYRPRFRSPFDSMVLTSSHASISDDTPTSESSISLSADVRLEKDARDLPHLQEINEPRQHRFRIDLIADGKEVSNRIDNHDGRIKSAIVLWITARCISSPHAEGRAL